MNTLRIIRDHKKVEKDHEWIECLLKLVIKFLKMKGF